MNKTKIDWCDMTWNPVTGCLNTCEYCYARSIANRFTGHFEPTMHDDRLCQPQKTKKPKNIFVCSMADLFGDWVPDEWMQTVFDACYNAPQHRYLFLTKNPERYGDAVEYLETDVKNYPDTPEGPPEIWLGASVTNNKQLEEAYYTSATWISIEPLHEELYTDTHFVSFCGFDGSEHARWDWVVIGAETGNRKYKIVPERAWVLDIVKECRSQGVPVFMKESLRELMGVDFVQEFPWEE